MKWYFTRMKTLILSLLFASGSSFACPVDFVDAKLVHGALLQAEQASFKMVKYAREGQAVLVCTQIKNLKPAVQVVFERSYALARAEGARTELFTQTLALSEHCSRYNPELDVQNTVERIRDQIASLGNASIQLLRQKAAEQAECGR